MRFYQWIKNRPRIKVLLAALLKQYGMIKLILRTVSDKHSYDGWDIWVMDGIYGALRPYVTIALQSPHYGLIHATLVLFHCAGLPQLIRINRRNIKSSDDIVVL